MPRPTNILAKVGAGPTFFTSPKQLLDRLAIKLERLHGESELGTPGSSSPITPSASSDARSAASAELRWLLDSLSASTSRAPPPRPDLSRPATRRHLISLVQRRIRRHEPLAYVLGDQPFGGLPINIKVRPPTLIPRPETEEWTLEVGRRLAEAIRTRSRETEVEAEEKYDDIRILDLCSGSGCIALLIAHLASEALDTRSIREGTFPIHITAADVSPAALQLIAENAQLQGFAQVGASAMRNDPQPHRTFQKAGITLTVRHADMFDDADLASLSSDTEEGERRSFDLILSNPPYIPIAEHAKLDKDVTMWEDPLALVGVHPRGASQGEMDDGLVFYRRIAELCSRGGTRQGTASLLAGWPTAPHISLDPNTDVPSLVLEVGQGQAQAVCTLLKETGRFRYIESRKDAWGVLRSVWAWV